MRVNYHTHTTRCNHAKGTEAEYVENALAAGIEVLGFSDHSPYLFDGDYYSWFRMRPEELPEYVATIKKLQEVYKGRIELPIGVEVEYYPALFSRLLPFLKDHGVEYLLLGQHYQKNEIGTQYSGLPTDDPQVLKNYCRQVRDGMQLGIFTYLAHPDLINFTGDPALYKTEMRGLCQEAKSCGMLLEYNLLGLRAGREYPVPVFWEMAAEEGCTAVLGVDAHDPQSLNDMQTEQQAREFLKTLGIALEENPNLVKI